MRFVDSWYINFALVIEEEIHEMTDVTQERPNVTNEREDASLQERQPLLKNENEAIVHETNETQVTNVTNDTQQEQNISDA